MSPRPRTISDHDVLAGAARAITRAGPAALTLADVAREVGLAPATLVQRFGSKRGLLLALAAGAAEATRQQFAALRAEHRSPLAALGAFATCLSGMAETPEALANHLAFLQIDLTDPEFHRHALAQSRTTRDELRALLDAAVAAGELAPAGTVDTAALARAVHVTLTGSLLTWAVHREGTAADWVGEDLAALLRPFRRANQPLPAARP
jgi:AcrR family transcriptional regulator